MKKTACILLSLVLLFSLFGCGKVSEVPEVPDSPDSPAPKASTSLTSAASLDLTSYDYTQYGYLLSDYPLPEDAESVSYPYFDDDFFSFTSVKYNYATENATYKTYSSVGDSEPALLMEITPDTDYNFNSVVYDGTQIWSVLRQEIPMEDDYLSIYTLQKRTSSGEVLMELELNTYFNGPDTLSILDLIPDADGGVWVSSLRFEDDTPVGSIVHFNCDLEEEWKLEEFEDRPYIAKTLSGDIVCLYDDQLWQVNSSGLTPTGIEQNNDERWYLRSGSGGYDVFLYDRSSLLYAVDLSSGTLVPLVDWSDCGLYDPTFLGAISESQFLVNMYILGDAHPMILTRVDVSEVPEKNVITLALLGEDGTILDSVAAFNLENPEYNIEVVYYEEQNQMDMDISTGKIPDIICTREGYDKYIQKGLLVDMFDLMEQYGGISTEDFVPTFLEASMTGDSLYVVANYFYIRTLAGLTEYVGDETGWSLEQFKEALKNRPDTMYPCDVDAERLLRYIVETAYSQYVDTESGICFFDSPDFISLLDILAEYADIGDLQLRLSTSELESVLNEEILLDILTVFPFNYIQYGSKYDLATLTGFPSEGGNGASFVTNIKCGIFSTSEHIEGAWQFVSFMLSYRAQCALGSGSYPVNQQALEAWLTNTADQYIHEYPDAYQRVQELVNYVSDIRLMATSETTVSDIVCEEAAAVFGGSKTAQEAADIIQNRVSTYLAEQS